MRENEVMQNILQLEKRLKSSNYPEEGSFLNDLDELLDAVHVMYSLVRVSRKRERQLSADVERLRDYKSAIFVTHEVLASFDPDDVLWHAIAKVVGYRHDSDF